MKSKKSKGFTLIELIAVLVIMAIIALIVTPLVMNIIRKARISADKRSVDAYGRSIELAIAGYLLDTGKFPTEVSQLTIEYSGNEVVCSTTQINKDSSVFLSGCTVAGRSVGDYSYGNDKAPTYQAYNIGDTYTLNNVDYYVIKSSGARESELTLLKAEPLTIAEVNQYGGVGTANNHVNKNACQSSNTSCYQTASNVYGNSGYGGMAYYSSEECGYNSSGNYVTTGCKLNYAESDIKYVVDAWATDKVGSKLQEARLLTLDDMMDDLGIEMNRTNPTTYQIVQTEDTPQWVFGENYYYWTMTPNTDKDIDVWYVNSRSSGLVYSNYVRGYDNAVRPVITISKSEI